MPGQYQRDGILVADSAGQPVTYPGFSYNPLTSVFTVPGGITPTTGQFLASDGTQAAPSYSFTNSPGSGFFYVASPVPAIIASVNGIRAVAFNANGFALPATAFYAFSSTTDPLGAQDVMLRRDAGGVLAQSNGANAQTFRIYGTTTGSVFSSISHNGTNAIIGCSGGSVYIQPAGAFFGYFTATAMIPNANGAQDLGASGVGFRRQYFDYTNTATVGAVTINKAAGRVNVAAAAASVVVTNSLCTAATLVMAIIAQNDATGIIKNVVAAAGSFTITFNVAPTANCAVNFFLISTD